MTNAVTAFRARMGWSQQRLADELGVTQATVSRWEAGVNAVPRPVRALIGRLTEAPPAREAA